MKHETYFTYILMNDRNTVLYIGVTNNVIRRVHEHREGKVRSFTQQYRAKKLVYYEMHGSAELAIAREKQLKRWHREWKMELVRSVNPDLLDLYNQLTGARGPETSSGRREGRVRS